MPILTFHHIGTIPADTPKAERGNWITPDLFRAQLQWLMWHNYKPLQLNDLVKSLDNDDMSLLPKRWMILTFDDGWRDNYLNALPILKELGLSATLFIVTRKIESDDDAMRAKIMMSKAEVREWLSAGSLIESHTQTHPHLDTLSVPDVRAEVVGAANDLREWFGLDTRWLCYPYGHFTAEIAAIIKELGYHGALSTIRDNRFTAKQRYWLPRVQVMNDTQPERLAYMDSLLYHFIHQRKNKRRYGEFV